MAGVRFLHEADTKKRTYFIIAARKLISIRLLSRSRANVRFARMTVTLEINHFTAFLQPLLDTSEILISSD